jgi:hypothetical protein
MTSTFAAALEVARKIEAADDALVATNAEIRLIA